MTAEQLEELANGFATYLHSEETIQHLARRVLAAEKLVEALARLGTSACFGSGEVLGMHLPESPMGREIIARMGFAKDAIIAYREASK